jgi:hypothetical protein
MRVRDLPPGDDDVADAAGELAAALDGLGRGDEAAAVRRRHPPPAKTG